MDEETTPDKPNVDEEARRYLEKLLEQKPELKDTLERVGAHLYFADDIVLVVLKGHLLIEEALTTIIRKSVHHGEFVDEANLRFYQKVQIARSLSLDEHQNEMWGLVLGLNRVRNDMAHALEHPKVADHISDLRNRYFQAFANVEEIQANKKEPDEQILKDLIVATLGFLSGFEKEVDRFRWWLSILDRFVNPHRQKKDKSVRPRQTDAAGVESE